MTLEDWIQVRVAIMLAWENARELTDDQLEGQYRLFPVLSKIGRDAAVQAVVEIASTAACESCRSGPRFAPGPGEIIARIHSWPLSTEQIMAAQEQAEQRKAARLLAAGLGPAVDDRREVSA